MNCRLCDRDITGKNGLLLYDYNEDVETKLGRKKNIILNSLDKNENLSNYCCDFCSCKIEICFRLLVEIQASDEVIRQTYKNMVNHNNVDTSTQLFICGECKARISGIKLFIKHYENHILKKSTVGSKKDMAISGMVQCNLKEETNKQISMGENLSNEKLTDVDGDIPVDDNVDINDRNLDYTESMEEAKEENVYVENDVEDVDDDDDDDDDDDEDYMIMEDEDYSSCSEKLSSEDDMDEFFDDKFLEDCNSPIQICENNLHESTKTKNDSEEPKEKPDNVTEGSDDSDAQSEDSYCSDESYKNLVGIVKRELEKTNEGESEDIKPSTGGTYNCDACNLAFEYKFVLEYHLKRNHKAFHDLDINNIKILTKYMGDENDSFIKCCYCKQSVLISELKDHAAECEEEYSVRKDILCQICGKMYGPRDLEKHMEEHKKIDGWACEICRKKFKAKRFLKSHLGEHDESKKKICEICGKKLLPLSFFSHIMKHKEKRHVCQYCGKAFTYNYGLRIHLRVHDDKKLEPKPEKKKDKVFCWLCKKDFDCTLALNMHLKTDHNAEGLEQDSRFPCSQCDKKFVDMFSLKAHLKLIHEMKDEDISRLKSLPVYRYIECNVCNKVFNSENKIRIHMKQDHGLKPFEMEILKKECEKCGKKFASKQNLIHHINGAHLHIKPMTCDICQEKFAKHSSLIYHKLRHSGEKPFQCEFCQKSYRQRNDVIRHLARHVRDKELTLEEASAVNNSPSRLVIKRRIFLKDSSINYQTIVRKNRRKSDVIKMEPILEEEINDIQEEQMEFIEDGMPGSMMYVEQIQVDENQPESPSDVPYINAKPVYNEERNTIILSSPDVLKNSVKNVTYRYIPSHLKHMPAVIVKKQEQI